MSVYYIAAPDVGMVKIGFTWNSPFKRLSVLQSGCPVSLTLAAVEQDAPIEIERARHAQFAADHVRGDWFRLTPAIQAHIDTLEMPTKPEDGRRSNGPRLRKYFAAQRAEARAA